MSSQEISLEPLKSLWHFTTVVLKLLVARLEHLVVRLESVERVRHAVVYQARLLAVGRGATADDILGHGLATCMPTTRGCGLERFMCSTGENADLCSARGTVQCSSARTDLNDSGHVS